MYLARRKVSMALHRECLQSTGDGKCSGAITRNHWDKIFSPL